MSIKEIKKFLTDAGFQVNLDEYGQIKEVINNSTKELLQQLPHSTYGNIFYSTDRKNYIKLSSCSIIICQNKLGICKRKNCLTI